MNFVKSNAKIKHILCPTDLSAKSQQTVGLAVRLAEKLGAELTICHCAENPWFSAESDLTKTEAAKIKNIIRETVVKYEDKRSNLQWRSVVVRNSFDPARDIINLAKATNADLIMMKARKGVFSALHYGSIVERVTRGAWCPVLLVPSRFLEVNEATENALDFQNILFDYQFSDEADRLLELTLEMSEKFDSKLHLIKILEPSGADSAEVAQISFSQKILQNITAEKLNHAITIEKPESVQVTATVEWGNEVESVLEYAAQNEIDLICATLAPPSFYLEKMYSVNLGRLLQKAECPLLVLQVQGTQRAFNFSSQRTMENVV